MDGASSSAVKKFQNDKDPKESVEEAVLKYVGVEIKDHGKKSKKRSKKHDKKKKHGSKKSHDEKDIEMDWYLKTSDANNTHKLDDIEPDSVAMAAIAAAYNSTVKDKHKKNRHKDGSGSKSEKKKHHKSKNSKREKQR